jgi:hypothetical protein
VPERGFVLKQEVLGFNQSHDYISIELISMLSPARPCSADGDDTSDLARVRGDGHDDRGEPPRSKRARTQERRAMQACFRCRKQKLRCLGGQPCVRCVKANKRCDFGKPGQASAAPSSSTNTNGKVVEDEDGDGVAAGARLEYLESRVANLLAGLDEPGTSGADLLPAPAPTPAIAPSIAALAAAVVAPVTAPAPAAALPAPGPPTYDTAAFPDTATPALLSTSGPPTTQGLGQVRFGNSPEVNLISPHSYSSRPETISPSREYDAGGRGKHQDTEEEAEERLASATRDGFEPPFQPLVYQVSLSDSFSCVKGGSR